jgi:GDPmannose 4,6-dehydratase
MVGYMTKRAFITGVNGQDGSYLVELLLSKDYQVFGWIPKSLPVRLDNINHVLNKIEIIEGDLQDQQHLVDCIEEYRPDEVYNFASPSFPATSWNSVVEVGETAGLGTARLLEAIRLVKPDTRFYQASSSELFGNPVEIPQSEDTPFHPRNPYGVAKLYAHWITVNYRQYYDRYCLAGILFNHESPRRGPEFVTKKVTRTAAKIKMGMTGELRLGNLEARRDWGFAGDYVEACWMMLQQDDPEEFVIGSGETHSVRDLCEIAFGYLNLNYQDYVIVDNSFYRPIETRQLVADNRKAYEKLGWEPKVSFKKLIEMMMDAEICELTKG